MDVDELKRVLQGFFSQTPLVIVGSGLSLGEGVSGMWDLSQHLKETIPSLVDESLLDEWRVVEKKIDEGEGFEDAMASLNLDSELVPFIISETASLVERDEALIFSSVVEGGRKLSFSLLLPYLLHNQNEVVVVTPNYDRLIEVACEIKGVDVITGFKGSYYGVHDPFGEKDKIVRLENKRNLRGGVSARAEIKKHVKIFKPHGSLDWYQIDGEAIRTQCNVDARRLIITPGTSKFRQGYQHPFDYHRETANRCIQSASSVLIIGYGFNDEQLEVHLLHKLRSGVPALVITKYVSPSARRVCDGLDNVILVSAGVGDNETIVRINGAEMVVGSNWWSLGEFVSGVLR